MLALLLLATLHPDPMALGCTAHRDRIDIVFPATLNSRIGSMAVVSGRTWTVLVDAEQRFVPFRPGVRRLSLRPSRQLGSVAGKTRRAFPHRGKYSIIVSDNLETEPENMMMHDCIVQVR